MTRLAPWLWIVVLGGCGGAQQTSGGTTTERGDEDVPAVSPAAITVADPRMAAIVDAHTRRRAEHCAPALQWSDALAHQAQAWVEHLRESGCQLEHSGGDTGENLAAGTEGTLSPEAVVEMWYGEVSQYDFDRGGFSMDTGHFTQLVWVGSTLIGCGVTSCDGLDVWACNYGPAGNVEGGYQANVLSTSCR